MRVPSHRSQTLLAHIVEREILPTLDVEQHRLVFDLLHHHSIPPTEDAVLVHHDEVSLLQRQRFGRIR